MTCKDCIHERVCFALIKDGLPYINDNLPAEAFCMTFKNKIDGAKVKADVVEVKHGKWDRNGYCSVCDYRTCYCNEYKYCPNCGAKMDEEEL